MNRPSLLLLSDLANGAEQEDIAIGDFLQKDFRVLMMYPRDCEEFEDSVDAIIIRNIWNERDYGKPEPWYKRWRSQPKLPIHDDLYIREGDFYSGSGESKSYLVWLYKNGFPVIPSIENITELDQLSPTNHYFIKPHDGFSAINARKIGREELIARDPQHYLIQPFIDFEYEVSFYYLDKQLQYALYAPDKENRWELVEYTPTATDIAFAERFIEWNPQKRGVERIDACRLKTGDLLLTEITDQGGVYLSILKLSEEKRLAFLENLSRSIQNIVR